MKHSHRPGIRDLSIAKFVVMLNKQLKDIAGERRRVTAQTLSASEIFQSRDLHVPAFQRRYTWRTAEEIAYFWIDLKNALPARSYFLGLLIFADDRGKTEVVDGQQRLLTITVLANCLRLFAETWQMDSLANEISDGILKRVSDSEFELPLQLASERDKEELSELLSLRPHMEPSSDGPLVQAHRFFSKNLAADLNEFDESRFRLQEWISFLNEGLYFTVYLLPDFNSAFSVYEVINTRGKVLTPLELVKAYLLSKGATRLIRRKWEDLERRFDELEKQSEFVTYIRHCLTLDLGFISNQGLYSAVSETFSTEEEIESFLDTLAEHLPFYERMFMLDDDAFSSQPPVTAELNNALRVVATLGLKTVRPIFLAIAYQSAKGESRDLQEILEAALRVVVCRAVSGPFGTGAVEARFARAARHVSVGEYAESLAVLDKLMPSMEEVQNGLREGLSRSLALVVRASILQETLFPDLTSNAVQIRPRGAGSAWPGFTDAEFTDVGEHLGNWMLIDLARRPRGANDPESAALRLSEAKSHREIVDAHYISTLTADKVRAESALIGERGLELWYAEIA